MEDVLFTYDDGKPKFEGDIVNGRMEGKGKYYFENGNVYVGEFLNNSFHGTGTIHFPGSGKYDATWSYGKAIDGKYTFNDGLEYQEENWTYCTPADRRFYTEHLKGIRPAGRDQVNSLARVFSQNLQITSARLDKFPPALDQICCRCCSLLTTRIGCCHGSVTTLVMVT